MLEDNYFSITQAANFMGVTRQTISRWVKDGLYSWKLGRTVLILKEDIKAAKCPTCGAIRRIK